MPVINTSSLAGPFIPNGVTTIFPFAFNAAQPSDVSVFDGDGALISPALFTVALYEGDGGTVTFATAPAAADYPKLWIALTPSFSQTADFTNAGPTYDPAQVTAALDAISSRIIALKGETDRAVKSAIGEDPVGVPDLQAIADEATAAAQAAAALRGPLYSDTASGIAATVSGEAFAVGDPTDPTNDIYVNSSGVAVFARTIIVAPNAPGTSGLLGHVASGTGAVPRTVQEELRDRVGVKQFGATGLGVANDSPAFNAAAAALPATGGTITVPTGTYQLDTVPNTGTKSIYWDIAPDAAFTGAGTGEGKFGYMKSNPAQLAVGPYVYSRTKLKSTNSNGGTAAFQVEFDQPADYGTGQAVALYAGAIARNAVSGANTWAANFVHRIEPGALGTHQLLEADVDCFSASATVKGISLSGAGTANPDIGIELTRVPASNTLWAEGVKVDYSQNGVVINPPAGARGVVLNAEGGNNVAAFSSTALSARQYANDTDTIFLQRRTDTAPAGDFLRAVNAANNVNLAIIDVLGNALFQNLVLMPGSSETPGANGQLTIEATSNTSLTFKFRGSDGTVRSASLALS